MWFKNGVSVIWRNINVTLSSCFLAQDSENIFEFSKNDQCLSDISGWQSFHSSWMEVHRWKYLGRLRELGLAAPALNLWEWGKGLRVKLIFNSQ